VNFSDVSLTNTVWWFGATAHPEDEDGVGFRNVEKLSHPDVAVCPKKIY
jgi:hypothetical protein